MNTTTAPLACFAIACAFLAPSRALCQISIEEATARLKAKQNDRPGTTAPATAPSADPRATNIFLQGLAYLRGDGVQVDDGAALRLFREAARLGSADGACYVALMYQHGDSVQKDERQAAIWFKNAAELGSARAMGDLAYAYLHGSGVGKDEKQAFAWMRKSAEAGDVNSMRNVAHMYDQGIGVVQDGQQADYWMRKAADGGDEKAKATLANAAQREPTKKEKEQLEVFRDRMLKSIAVDRQDAEAAMKAAAYGSDERRKAADSFRSLNVEWDVYKQMDYDELTVRLVYLWANAQFAYQQLSDDGEAKLKVAMDYARVGDQAKQSWMAEAAEKPLKAAKHYLDESGACLDIIHKLDGKRVHAAAQEILQHRKLNDDGMRKYLEQL